MALVSSDDEEEVIPIKNQQRILSSSYGISESPASSYGIILITDFLAVTNKAIPNQFRPACKKHVKCTKCINISEHFPQLYVHVHLSTFAQFEDFWSDYFNIFDQEREQQYHSKFIELKIDDIRCIPFLNRKHLSTHVGMLTNDVDTSLIMIQQFNHNRDTVKFVYIIILFLSTNEKRILSIIMCIFSYLSGYTTSVDAQIIWIISKMLAF